jgi:hypothetical protein
MLSGGAVAAAAATAGVLALPFSVASLHTQHIQPVPAAAAEGTP